MWSFFRARALACAVDWLTGDDPVRISGWLMLDPEHRNHLNRYRNTLWEIHPLTKVEVLENGQAELAIPEPPFYATASPEERAQAILDWGRSHRPRNAPPLSDEAIRRESIYFGERD